MLPAEPLPVAPLPAAEPAEPAPAEPLSAPGATAAEPVPAEPVPAEPAPAEPVTVPGAAVPSEHSRMKVLPASSLTSRSQEAPLAPTSLSLWTPALTSKICWSRAVAFLISSTNRLADSPAGSAGWTLANGDAGADGSAVELSLSRTKNFTARKPPSTSAAIATPIATSRAIDDRLRPSGEAIWSIGGTGTLNWLDGP